MRITDTDALIVIDPQNDFCHLGALPVEGGDEIMTLVNAIARKFKNVIISQDWHDTDQISFASNHEGKQPFDMIETDYGPQVLWPDHCVQNSWGAMFHNELDIPHAQAIIRKGYNKNVDSYSAFMENDKVTQTGLGGLVIQRQFKRLFFVGLAYDFCVGYSAIDATNLQGHSVKSFIIKDATRAIDLNGSLAEAERNFEAAGVRVINSTYLV